MKKNPPKKLFILAGFRAAGKTTLLVEAVKNGISLFGTDYATDIQAIGLPTKPLAIPSYLEAVGEKSWFDMAHIYELAHDESIHSPVVIHLDLLSLLFSSGTCIDSREVLTPMLPRTLETAYSEQQISHSLVRYFSHRFFQQFDHVVVNCLFTPWEICKSQWLQRSAKASQSFDLFEQYVLEEGAVGESIHKAAYNGFATAWLYLKPRLFLQSQFLHGKLVVKTLFRSDQPL